MKKSLSIALLFICIISCKSQKHSDHMGMRTTTVGDPSLGCKEGHLWERIDIDDWVDIGPVTDSCNCNPLARKWDYPCVDDNLNYFLVFNMVFHHGEYIETIPTESLRVPKHISKLLYAPGTTSAMMFCCFGIKRESADSLWKEDFKK